MLGNRLLIDIIHVLDMPQSSRYEERILYDIGCFHAVDLQLLCNVSFEQGGVSLLKFRP